MKKEHFRADKDGNLDRSRDSREKQPIETYEQKFARQFKESSIFLKLVLATVDYLTNAAMALINAIFGSAFKSGFGLFKDQEEELKKENRIKEQRIKQGGVIIRYTYLRYLITMLLPPLGIFMSKGIMGWVNILISIALMYVNYFLGIAYAILITHNSYYSDFYGQTQEQIYKDLIEEENIDTTSNQAKLIFIIICSVFAGLIVVSLFKLMVKSNVASNINISKSSSKNDKNNSNNDTNSDSKNNKNENNNDNNSN